MTNASDRRESTYRVIFFKGEDLVDPDKADRVTVLSLGHQSYSMELRWPAQKRQLAALEGMLQQAELLGAERARATIRNALGVVNCICEDDR